MILVSASDEMAVVEAETPPLLTTDPDSEEDEVMWVSQA